MSLSWIELVLYPVVLDVLLVYLDLARQLPYVLTSPGSPYRDHLFLSVSLLKHAANPLIRLIDRQFHVNPPNRDSVRSHKLIFKADLWRKLRILHQFLCKLHQYHVEGECTVEKGYDEEEEGELGVSEDVRECQEVKGGGEDGVGLGDQLRKRRFLEKSVGGDQDDQGE